MLSLHHLKPSSEHLGKWLIVALVAVPIFGYGIYAAWGAAIISKTLPSADVVSGLVGHWTFDGKNMVSNVADISGNGNNGSLSGQTSTTTVEGRVGQALSFDGTDDFVDAGNGSSLNISTGGSVTMCAWVKSLTGSNATWRGLMAKRDDGGSPQYAYGINFVTNNFQIYTSGTSGVAGFVYNLPALTWTHVCGVISATSATALYVNGSLFGTSGSGGGVASNTTSLRIGKSSGTGVNTEYFNGWMDDVRIYSRALSASEIARLYHMGAR